MRRAALTTALLVPLLLTACGSGSGTPPMTDFLLQDVNPTSTTYMTGVSPRQFIGQLSAYYFGSAL